MVCCAASGPSSRVRPAAKAGPPSTPSLRMGRRGRGPWSPCRSRNQCGEWMGEKVAAATKALLYYAYTGDVTAPAHNRSRCGRGEGEKGEGGGEEVEATTPARIVFENTLDAICWPPVMMLGGKWGGGQK